MLRLGFLLLVLVFGVSMFGAGVAAPAEVSAPVSEVLERVALSLQDRYRAAERWAGAAAQSESGKGGDDLLQSDRYGDLLLTRSSATPSAYAVQVGWHAELTAARQQAQLLREQGHPVQLIGVGGDPASRSVVVAVGPFAQIAQARQVEQALRASPLALAPIVPIRLPSAPAPTATAAAPASPARGSK